MGSQSPASRLDQLAEFRPREPSCGGSPVHRPTSQLTNHHTHRDRWRLLCACQLDATLGTFSKIRATPRTKENRHVRTPPVANDESVAAVIALPNQLIRTIERRIVIRTLEFQTTPHLVTTRAYCHATTLTPVVLPGNHGYDTGPSRCLRRVDV